MTFFLSISLSLFLNQLWAIYRAEALLVLLLRGTKDSTRFKKKYKYPKTELTVVKIRR